MNFETMNFEHLIKNIWHCIIYLTILYLTGCSNQSKNSGLNIDRIDTPSNLNTADSKFIIDAAELTLEGIDMGKLAQTNTDNQHVHFLGQELVIDNRKILNQLKIIAVHKTISLPDEMNSIGRDAYEKLMIKKGSEFDAQFSGVLVTIDTCAMRIFEKELKYAQDSEVKGFSASSLQIIKDNLTNAKPYIDSLPKATLQ